MSKQANAGTMDRDEDVRSEPAIPAAVETTETYQTDDGTVFYDAENPLAWLQTDEPVVLHEVA